MKTGEPWKSNRRIFLNYLRQWGKEKQFQLILEEIGFLQEEIEKNPESLEISHLLEKVFCNVICTFIFGARNEYTDPDIDIILDCMEMFNMRVPFIPDFFWPILAKFPITPSMKKRKDGIRKIKNYIKRKIDPILSSGPRNPPETLVEGRRKILEISHSVVHLKKSRESGFRKKIFILRMEARIDD